MNVAISKFCFAVSLFCLLFFSSCIFVGYINQLWPVDSWTREGAFPIALLICSGITILVIPGRASYRIFQTFVGAVVVLSSIYASTLFMDYSWDGLTYHQRAVLRLIEGTNFLSFADPTENVWVNNYGKATWYYGATLYEGFHRAEAGSSYHFVLLSCLFFYTLYFCLRIQRGLAQSIVFAVLVALNPVTLVQIYTYYNDAALGMMSIVAIFSVFLLKKNNSRRDSAIFIICCILLVNIKTSGFIVVGATFMYFFFHDLARSRNVFDSVKKVFVPFSFFIVFGVLLLGYSPYVQNVMNERHIFYPLAGDGAINIMTSNEPAGFAENDRLTNLLTSIFSSSSNLNITSSNEEPRLKVPGTFESSELEHFWAPDARTGGFGPLFSLVMLAGLAAFFTAKNDWRVAAPLLFVLIITIAINPYSWWARYVPTMWVLPLLPIVTAKPRSQAILGRVFLVFLVFCASANIALILSASMRHRVEVNSRSKEIIAQVRDLKLFSGDFVPDLQLNGMGIQFSQVDQDYYNANRNSFESLWGGILYEID